LIKKSVSVVSAQCTSWAQKKLEWRPYTRWWWCVHSFRHNTITWRTDRRTNRQKWHIPQ